MANVVTQAASADAKVIFAGDTQQLQAVENGGGMSLLADALGYAQLTRTGPVPPRLGTGRQPAAPRRCSAPFFLSTWKRVGVVRHEHAGPGLAAGVRFRARRHGEHAAARCRSRDHGRGQMVVMMSFPGG